MSRRRKLASHWIEARDVAVKEQAEAAALVPRSSLHSMPSEIIQQIVGRFNMKQLIRAALASHDWRVLMLNNVKVLTTSLIPESWTKLVSEVACLAHLVDISIRKAYPSSVVAKILRLSPVLTKLDVAFEDTRVNQRSDLAIALKTHERITNLRIVFGQGASTKLLDHLPPNLSSLEFDLRGKQVFTLPACPNLTKLYAYAYHCDLADELFEQLRTMTKLTSLVLKGNVLFAAQAPSTEAENFALVDKIAAAIPPPAGGKWERLEVSKFDVDDMFVYMSAKRTISVLRYMLTKGMVPSRQALNGAFKSGCLQAADAQAQVERIRFWFDECGLRPEPCRCTYSDDCPNCEWWYLIFALHVDATKTIVEEYFLQFVKDKSNLTGQTEDQTAAKLINGFSCDYFTTRSTVYYLNKLNYPLDLNYGAEPLFATLPDEPCFDALLARAKAQHVTLNFDVVASCYSVEIALRVATMDLRFFLRNLANFFSYASTCQDEVLAIAKLARQTVPELVELALKDVPLSPRAGSEAAPLVLAELEPSREKLAAILDPIVFGTKIAHGCVIATLVGMQAYDLYKPRAENGDNWMHRNLIVLGRYWAKKADQPDIRYEDLLLETNTDGNTPLHCLVASWDYPPDIRTLRLFQNILQYIKKHKLFDKKNNAGKTPLEMASAKFLINAARHALPQFLTRFTKTLADFVITSILPRLAIEPVAKPVPKKPPPQKSGRSPAKKVAAKK